jgi:hypothetical protein
VSGTRYSIVVRGGVDVVTLERLGGPEPRPIAELTELVCDVVDQSQLVGLLSALSGVGIEVIRATPLES